MGTKRQREEESETPNRIRETLLTVQEAKAVLQAHSLNTSEAVLCAISELKKLGQLPLEVLRETQIGKHVNQVSKEAGSDEIRQSLKELLLEWKALYRKGQQRAGSAPACDVGPSRTASDACAGGTDEMLTLDLYRKRLGEQQKYYEPKPGTRSIDNCLQDPPTLPPLVIVCPKREPLPARSVDGHLVFPDFPDFKPNLSPKQVLQAGSFGGTYFRDISSAVTGLHYKGREVIKEFPNEWLEGLLLEEQVISQDYRKSVNKYLVACGGSLGMWETSGWISAIDPYGWFHWYCRFYLGRRSSDDERQVDRWLKGQGPKGRWRLQLMNKIIKERKKFDDEKVSPVIRQVLLHWAYELTSTDFEAYKELKLKQK